MRSVTEGHRSVDETGPGSDRNFGLVMAGAAAIFGCLPLLRLAAPHLGLVGVAIAFAALAPALPRAPYPLDLLWFRFRLLPPRILSPLVIRAGVFFFRTP